MMDLHLEYMVSVQKMNLSDIRVQDVRVVQPKGSNG